MMVGQLRAEGWAICHWKVLLHNPRLEFQANVPAKTERDNDN